MGLSALKQEITATAVISEAFEMDGLVSKLAGFHQGTETLRAQNFAYFLPIFHHGDSLQVGSKGALGGFLGPRAIPTERSCLSTMSTLCHVTIPFLTNEPTFSRLSLTA